MHTTNYVFGQIYCFVLVHHTGSFSDHPNLCGYLCAVYYAYREVGKIRRTIEFLYQGYFTICISICV